VKSIHYKSLRYAAFPSASLRHLLLLRSKYAALIGKSLVSRGPLNYDVFPKRENENYDFKINCHIIAPKLWDWYPG